MPDHYHLIRALAGKKSLSEILRSIDHFSVRKINLFLSRTGKLWEDGFYDHAIRNQDDFREIVEYIHNNPVKNGLAESTDEYPYSSCNPKYIDMVNGEWFI